MILDLVGFSLIPDLYRFFFLKNLLCSKKAVLGLCLLVCFLFFRFVFFVLFRSFFFLLLFVIVLRLRLRTRRRLVRSRLYVAEEEETKDERELVDDAELEDVSL